MRDKHIAAASYQKRPEAQRPDDEFSRQVLNQLIYQEAKLPLSDRVLLKRTKRWEWRWLVGRYDAAHVACPRRSGAKSSNPDNPLALARKNVNDFARPAAMRKCWHGNIEHYEYAPERFQFGYLAPTVSQTIFPCHRRRSSCRSIRPARVCGGKQHDQNSIDWLRRTRHGRCSTGSFDQRPNNALGCGRLFP